MLNRSDKFFIFSIISLLVLLVVEYFVGLDTTIRIITIDTIVVLIIGWYIKYLTYDETK
jgi:hypothetical protein